MRISVVALVLALGVPSAVTAQAPVCGSVDLDASIPSTERTQVLVLASQHLRRIVALDRAALDPLLDELESWAPAAIGVEVLPPRLIASMETSPLYDPALEAFAARQQDAGRLARDLLGITRSEAVQRADSLYEALETAPPGRQSDVRRQLIPLLVASYALDDAVLQWAYLTADTDGGSDSIPDTLQTLLEARLEMPDETVTIGLALARRLGLARLHPIDDHTETDLFLAIAGDLATQLESSDLYRELVESGDLEESERELRAAHETGDLLPYYLRLNSREAQARDVDLQWRFFFRTRLPSALDRYRVALWEVRNLAMAAHVRRMTAALPGERALVVVGASHKPFLDAYLSCGMDVEVVHLREVVEDASGGD